MNIYLSTHYLSSNISRLVCSSDFGVQTWRFFLVCVCVHILPSHFLPSLPFAFNECFLLQPYDEG